MSTQPAAAESMPCHDQQHRSPFSQKKNSVELPKSNDNGGGLNGSIEVVSPCTIEDLGAQQSMLELTAPYRAG
jgi:hypothetical protein